ncbi:protein of unknown function [Methylorubrum extorquens]|uniref:Uncharacterized protein n=1 Tax=Methylorubrum extorquens TaxID=408 RepID=A0A2N9AXI5_METEX|nr:protein of unknown function [Methylorubrum extorquens]
MGEAQGGLGTYRQSSPCAQRQRRAVRGYRSNLRLFQPRSNQPQRGSLFSDYLSSPGR